MPPVSSSTTFTALGHQFERRVVLALENKFPPIPAIDSISLQGVKSPGFLCSFHLETFSTTLGGSDGGWDFKARLEFNHKLPHQPIFGQCKYLVGNTKKRVNVGMIREWESVVGNINSTDGRVLGLFCSNQSLSKPALDWLLASSVSLGWLQVVIGNQPSIIAAGFNSSAKIACEQLNMVEKWLRQQQQHRQSRI